MKKTDFNILLIACIFISFLTACSSSADSTDTTDGPQDTTQTNIDENDLPITEQEIEHPISEDEKRAKRENYGKPQTVKKAPHDLVLLGKQFITGRKWEDANGQNIICFSFNEEMAKDEEMDSEGIARSLYAEHFVYKNGNTELVRKVQDFEKGCAFDNQLYLDEKSIQLTDLDEDGVQEISFVYTLGCVSDISRYGMKLILLEGGQKYPVRGRIRLKHETGEPNDPDRNFGEEFKDAPEIFKTHATELWKKHEVK